MLRSVVCVGPVSRGRTRHGQCAADSPPKPAGIRTPPRRN